MASKGRGFVEMKKIGALDLEDMENADSEGQDKISLLQGKPVPAKESQEGEENPEAPTFRQNAIVFTSCFLGLQASYLTWGVLQEAIMTTEFEKSPMIPTGLFPSASFVVFCNRILAMLVAGIICLYRFGSVFGTAPFYALAPCAVSNTSSSYCQYASLNYVTFPMQNLFKSMKIIPVMIMGKLLNGKAYPWVQYFEALVITAGVVVFGQADKEESFFSKDEDSSLHLIGLSFLLGYVIFDCFTSQYQSRVFETYGKVDQYHMMFGVNLWAIIFTISAILFNKEIAALAEFISYNPNIVYYLLATGTVSTTGQLFLYYTIKRFGPVALTIIMTTRQMFSMVISSMLYGHPMNIGEIVGEIIVFSAVGFGIYRNFQNRNKPPPASSSSS